MKSAPIRITMPVKIIEAELISALKLDICLRDFKKIEDDFINELNFNNIFLELREKGILNEYKINQKRKDIKKLYSNVTQRNVPITLRDSTIHDMKKYIFTLKNELLSNEKFVDLESRVIAFKKVAKSNYTSSNSQKLPKNINNEYEVEILFYLEKISEIDKEVHLEEQKKFNNIKDFSSQRTALLLNSLKLKLHELTKNKIKLDICKDNILTMYNNLKNSDLKDLSLIEEIDNFLKTKNYNEDLYNKLYKVLDKKYQDLILAKEEKKIINNIVNSLMKLDYFVINDTNDLEVKLENKENIILDIKGKDYSVFLKINDKNELLTRFVRKIDSEDDEKNITDSQKIIDKENLKHWCSLYGKFSKELLEDKIIIEVNTIEDDEADVIYYVNRNKSNDLQQNKQLNKRELHE